MVWRASWLRVTTWTQSTLVYERRDNDHGVSWQPPRGDLRAHFVPTANLHYSFAPIMIV